MNTATAASTTRPSTSGCVPARAAAWASRCLLVCCTAGCALGSIGDASTESHASRPGAVGSADAGAADGVTKVPGSTQPLLCTEPSAGPAPLRRLTREHYLNGVRDLLGETVVREALPADGLAGPFYANVHLPIDELGTQQYMELGEAIARAALSSPSSLLPCDPSDIGEEACAARFIEDFGRRAYRRALTPDELERYVALHADFAQTQSFEDGLRVVVQTMLQSPHFLYHVESSASDAAQGELVRLDGHALAARLSYLLWGSTPDAALLTAAEQGELDDPAALREHAGRMLDDPRAQETLAAFHTQWLGLNALAAREKDDQVYPGFDAPLRDAMRRETADFVRHVIFEDDGSLATLLQAPYSVIDGPLFAHYDVPRPEDHVPGTPVPLDPTQRAGILTQGAFLAVHAHANQSAPVLRGVHVLRHLLCQKLPDPPANVDVSAPDPAPNATTRERFIEHEKDPVCGSCHRSIDGIGFGFEAYDGVGRYRTLDQGHPVDAHGQIIGTSDIDGPFEGAVALVTRLAESDDVRQCYVRQWLRFALGRLEDEADACSLASLGEAFQASHGDIRGLLLDLVESDAFRLHRREP